MFFQENIVHPSYCLGKIIMTKVLIFGLWDVLQLK
jgi:hypothetical protein